jgi:ABC-type multidrug transport system fused ATPase/permease subunit
MQPEPEHAGQDTPPDRVPEELVDRYGREARRMVRQHLSRRHRLAQGMRRAVGSADSELWETTAVVFFFGVIAVCGLGGLAYAVYLWPKIGLSLLASLLVLFGLSLFIARRITRRRQALGDSYQE